MKFKLGQKRIGKIVSINTTMISILDEFNLKEPFLMERLRNTWKNRVGGIIAAHTIPENIYNKILYISVDHSVYANELSLMKNHIIQSINDEFGSKIICDIRMKKKILNWSKKTTN